jgi:hypothetical protein
MCSSVSIFRTDAIPSLISFLRSSIQAGANPLQLPRTLLILLQIIKELSTARLQKAKTSLQSVSPEIFHLLGNIYIEKVNAWGSLLDSGSDANSSVQALLEQSLVSLKVLRRLVIAGFAHPNRDTSAQDFWQLTHSHFTRFYRFLGSNILPSTESRRLVEKHVLQLSKLHVEMARVHPASFALLPGCVVLVNSYWAVIVKLGEDIESQAAGILKGDGESGPEGALVDSSLCQNGFHSCS